ncbi:MAG TPA: sugar phosphate isomerase/epimerase family protein [Burkholderiales bacterium]|nr:sugar phosphate isomerase/epimerase family protein [Burkholderiales bacterium]
MSSASPPNPELLALNTASVREKWTLREIIDGCTRYRFHGISLWRDRLEQMGVKEAAKAAGDGGLTITGLCGGGRFPAAERKARRAAIDDTRRAIDDAAGLEARCLVLVAGALPGASKDLAGAREMIRDGIGEVLDHARAAGVPLAIEPQHPMHCAAQCCVNTLAQALDLCEELDRGGAALGIAVDVHHVWWDPQLKAQIERAGERRLLAFQISDWLLASRDMLTDRGMMGDGVIDLPLVRSWMEEAGYRGFHDVEILSADNWWRRDPEELLATCRMRHRLAC